MIRISPLKNRIQEYAWGSRSAIQDLLNLPAESRQCPMAELWMGAHPVAPSSVLVRGEWESLAGLVEKLPEQILGREVADSFNGKLPFLFKVLAAARPLSIQVHPAREEAVEGFRREDLAGIALKDPRRMYKDDSHKPELICALSRFTALKGFRPLPQSLELLQSLVPKTLSRELHRFGQRPDEKGLKGFFKEIMTLDEEKRKNVAKEAVESAENRASSDDSFSWVARLGKAYPGDMGILSPALMNLVVLSPGQALYIGSNTLHAYLDGVGLEVMANSDNVIRGGLTPKHVDVHELLRSVDFRPGLVEPLLPKEVTRAEKTYPCPAREFLLCRVHVNAFSGEVEYENPGIRIFLCLEGKGEFRDTQTREETGFSKGDSILIPGAVKAFRIRGDAVLYGVSVPLTG